MGGHYLMLHHGVTIAYAESFEQVPANMAEVRPTIMCSVPRLYEKMYARVQREGGGRPARCARRSSAGRSASARELFRAPASSSTTPGPRRCACKAALADKLVFCKITRAHRRPAAPVRLRRRAARRARSPSSSAPPASHPRGLRPHRDEPGHHRQHARRAAARQRGPAHPRRRGEDRSRRRDPHPRPARHEGLLQQAARRPRRRSTPTAGSTPATSASSTRTASWSSPTARRTSSSPPAARTSRPSPSRTCSRRNRFIGEVVMIGNKRNFPGRARGPELRDPREVGDASRASPSAGPRGADRTTRGACALYDLIVQDLTADLAPVRAHQEDRAAAEGVLARERAS